MERQRVALYRKADLRYPEAPPFHPPEAFPEYPFAETAAGNEVYRAVRETFRLLGLDSEHEGTAEWNPLGRFIRPGDLVVLKPNLVRHYNPSTGSLECTVTHASVVRAVLDYAVIALKDRGRIVVGDAPLQTCDFSWLVREIGLDEVASFVRRRCGIEVDLLDFRKETAVKDEQGVILRRSPQAGPPVEHVAVRLDGESYLAEVADRWPRFRVTNYDPGEMTSHHNRERHEYLVARPVLEADCVINLPKLKTHRKVGLTAALKNVVGINGSKDWLPHHANGSSRRGGDQYRDPCLRKELASWFLDRAEGARSYRMRAFWRQAQRAVWRSRRLRPFPEEYFEGSWYGNDTLWRTVLDLNRILFFTGADGAVRFGAGTGAAIHASAGDGGAMPPLAGAPGVTTFPAADDATTETTQAEGRHRRYFALVDAVVVGEGEGPVDASPRSCGVLVAGDHPTPVDTCCALLAGFDPARLPLVARAWSDEKLGYDPDWTLLSNAWPDRESLRRGHLGFRPPSGWAGHVPAGRV